MKGNWIWQWNVHLKISWTRENKLLITPINKVKKHYDSRQGEENVEHWKKRRKYEERFTVDTHKTFKKLDEMNEEKTQS